MFTHVYQLKQWHIPQGLYQDLQNFTFPSFHSAYSYTLWPIYAHSFTNYWFIYLFGSLLPCNFNECKLSLILKNNWQKSVPEPDIDVVPNSSSFLVWNIIPIIHNLLNFETSFLRTQWKCTVSSFNHNFLQNIAELKSYMTLSLYFMN